MLRSAIALALSLPVLASASPYPSTYQVPPGATVLIRNATVLIGTGEKAEGTDVLLAGGVIAAIGNDLDAPAGARIIDGKDKVVTPGLIDVHSHLGVYAAPAMSAHNDGNEMTAPTTPNVWAEHSLNPNDPGFDTARAGGVTSMQILPGSANLIGGRGITVKNVPATTYQAMKFPGAPHGLKMACGENPKRVYGGKGAAPMTNMGNVAGYRKAFLDAQEYMRTQDEFTKKLIAWERGDKDDRGDRPTPPKTDLALETLAGALRGDVLVHNHCYRADEMATMLDLADEFGFKITAFHHAVEAYKIADLLADKGVCGALWADWWGFKMEALDGIQENIAFVDAAKNGCAIVHSDSGEGIQRLNQEAAKAMARGNRAGLGITPEHAIRWLTANAAKALGIADRVGTLEVGKQADVVIWNGNPFSVYAKAEQVFIDGALRFDRNDRSTWHQADVMLGMTQEVTP
ncbi:MAG TPA: amidohydrolase [Patescibacteria group bacterium]|nr:amidohydrolase [Patescibacteria group bacterium]